MLYMFAGNKNSILGKNIHILGQERKLVFRHFSNTFELSEFLCERFGYDSTDFSRPKPKRIRQSGDIKDSDWIFVAWEQ